MAGGEGAKERRRLKRLAAQEAKNKKAGTPSETTKVVKDTSSKNVRDNRNTKRGPSTFGGKGGKNKPNNGKKDKKPKFKKPKHLKRKLEQASTESGEAKEVIQKEIEQFEAKKIFYSKQNRGNKRQKSSNYRGSDSKKEEDAVSRLNRINSNSTPFPRNEKPDTEKSAMIEDDDIEMADKIEPKERSEMAGSKEDTKDQVEITKDEPRTGKNESDEESNSESSDDESSDDGTNESGSSEQDEPKSEEKSGKVSNDEDDSASDSSDDSDDDSDDDSEDDEPVQQRQRGRRRRGRQDTAKKIEEMEAEEKSKASTESSKKTKDEPEGKNDNDGKKRYCIGRKPVTDFVIGQTHRGKVVYVKPFGVFFDIGCHSDAFCHVSRLSDDYIESPGSKFKEGDEVPNVRIVEIDRKQKRITVSLQSEARLEDERKSIEARTSRKEKRKEKSKKKPSTKSSGNSTPRFENSNVQGFPVSNKFVEKRADPPPVKKDPSTMTPAELKRARKLERRAQRRAQAEQEQS